MNADKRKCNTNLEKIDSSAMLIVMAGEGPPSSTYRAACRKVVVAGLRRHDAKAAALG
jgi:hypothetical protein